MTEIPEHLLKRSKERRAALGGGEAPAPDSAAASASAIESPGTDVAPAAAQAATPAKVEPALPPAPPPDPPYVAAYKSRKKIPVWAMMTLSILPLWAFMYVRSLTPVKEAVRGPLGEGASIYSGSCSSCHGATGAGGAGRPLIDGDTQLTFPHIEDQLNFVYQGSQNYALAGLSTYGDPNRPGGARQTLSFGQMPGWGAEAGGELTDAQILSVVCHERYTLSGADPESPEWSEEYETWCSEESPIFVGLEDGSLTFEDIHTSEAGEGALPVLTEPRPNSPK